MLDEINQGIHANLCKLRLNLIEQGRPLVGDVVHWPNGQVRRISHDWEDSYQTSFWTSGSFFATASGHASFSGGLQPPVLAEFLIQTEEIQQAGFWFFRHNRSGAGRGVQCQLPCRVWRLEPFTRTREEAAAHPKTIESMLLWGENKPRHLEMIEEIMNPRVISKPEYF